MIDVIINGQPCRFICQEDYCVTYDDVVMASGMVGDPTITYRKAKDGKQGMLTDGETVQIVDGTIFNVVDTGNA